MHIHFPSVYYACRYTVFSTSTKAVLTTSDTNAILSLKTAIVMLYILKRTSRMLHATYPYLV